MWLRGFRKLSLLLFTSKEQNILHLRREFFSGIYIRRWLMKYLVLWNSCGSFRSLLSLVSNFFKIRFVAVTFAAVVFSLTKLLVCMPCLMFVYEICFACICKKFMKWYTFFLIYAVCGFDMPLRGMKIHESFFFKCGIAFLPRFCMCV